MAQFVVPTSLEGKTINDLRSLYGGGTGVYSKLLGVGENTPFTAGQRFSVDPTDPGLGEFQAIQKNFTPGDVYNANQAKEQEDAFMTALNAKIGGQEKLGDMATRIGGELGLPALRESAFQLTDTLKKIPKVQETVAKQVGISAPRLAQRTAAEQGKIAPLAQDAVSQQQFAETELGTRLGYGVAEQEKELRPFFEAQLPLLQDRLARENSNYQQDKQDELDILLTKMSQNFEMTQNELDRAATLAKSEKDYANEIAKIKFQTDEDIRKSKATKTNTNNNVIVTPGPNARSTSGIQSLW